MELPFLWVKLVDFQFHIVQLRVNLLGLPEILKLLTCSMSVFITFYLLLATCFKEALFYL